MSGSCNEGPLVGISAAVWGEQELAPHHTLGWPEGVFEAQRGAQCDSVGSHTCMSSNLVIRPGGASGDADWAGQGGELRACTRGFLFASYLPFVDMRII